MSDNPADLGCPGSDSDVRISHPAATARGVATSKGLKREHLEEAGAQHEEDITIETLADPKTEPVKVIGPEDVIKERVTWMIFGLLATITIGGLAALTVIALTGADSSSVIDYLKMVIPILGSLATFVAGYYYGKRRRKEGDGED